MSATCRTAASKLRQRYSKQFDLPIDQVEIKEREGDEADVFAPTRPDLPRWSTGPYP